jgi:hypothetical protein
MKRFYFGTVAIIIAIAISAVTPKNAIEYAADATTHCYLFLIYNGFGDQYDQANYDLMVTQPDACAGSDKLCWIYVRDEDCDGTISREEFEAALYRLDNDYDGILDDEQESNELEKRF